MAGPSHRSGANAAYPVLFSGVVAASFAAVLIRLCDAPPLVIAAYRLALASLLLAPAAMFLRVGGEFRTLDPPSRALAVFSGIFLGLHFAAWVTSLSYTSVVSSVVLVTTNPIFVGLASHILLKEPVSRRVAAGIGVSVLGGGIIGFGDMGSGSAPVLGDALALMGALLMSAYLLAGRKLRPRLSLLSYIFPIYAIAGITLILLCVMTGQHFFGYSRGTYLLFLLLALVPQLIGHSALNWALRHLSPSMVAVALLGEPVGATVLAYLFLHEVPTLPRYLGSGLVLVGIYLATRI